MIDEAASRLRMEIDSKPANLDAVDRDIMQLEIEREALKKEKDKASKERLQVLEAELANLKEESMRLATQWEAEKDAIQQVRAVKEAMDQVRVQVEQAQRDYNYQQASELQFGRMRQLEEQLAAAERQLVTIQQDGAMLKEEVDSEEIAAVVSKWTGIPVSRLLEGEVEN